MAPALTSPALAGGVLRDTGWWVVLGSFPNYDFSVSREEDVEIARARAARCGIDPFNDFSNKFLGFAPGYDVVAVGAFADPKTARAVLRRVRACIPDAYVKFGRHLGE